MRNSNAKEKKAINHCLEWCYDAKLQIAMAPVAPQHLSKTHAFHSAGYAALRLLESRCYSAKIRLWRQFQENMCLAKNCSNDDCEACLRVMMPMQAQAMQLCKATAQARSSENLRH